jgi:hypothetical protein
MKASARLPAQFIPAIPVIPAIELHSEFDSRPGLTKLFGVGLNQGA